MDQQSNGINIIIQGVTITVLYFFFEENHITVTSNTTSSGLNKLRRHNPNDTHTNKNPMPSPNNTTNPPAQPTTNQPLQPFDNPPVQPTNDPAIPLESNKGKNDEGEGTSNKRFQTNALIMLHYVCMHLLNFILYNYASHFYIFIRL